MFVTKGRFGGLLEEGEELCGSNVFGWKGAVLKECLAFPGTQLPEILSAKCKEDVH